MSKTRRPVTPLAAFILARGVRPGRLAVVAGVSRQHLTRLMSGKADPTRAVMVRITRACAQLTHSRVSIGDLFDLDTADAASDVDAINPS